MSHLSQCNSQIILRITNTRDQNAIIESSEQLSQSLFQDLPGLNIGEAIVVGPVTKLPVMIRIRQRKTKEGGSDIDVVKKLKDSRNILATRKAEQENTKKAKQNFDGSF